MRIPVQLHLLLLIFTTVFLGLNVPIYPFSVLELEIHAGMLGDLGGLT